MTTVMVSIRHAYQNQEYDLEVSSNMLVSEFMDQLTIRLGWITQEMAKSFSYSIEVVPEKFIPLNLTFAQANIWSGSALIFHPPGSGQHEGVAEKAPKQSEKGYQFIQLD